jgi:hypothetical protein
MEGLDTLKEALLGILELGTRVIAITGVILIELWGLMKLWGIVFSKRGPAKAPEPRTETHAKE